MNAGFGFGFGFLFSLPVLIARWVGVIALGKAGRNGVRWCLLIGTALATLGSLGSIAAIDLMAANSGSRGFDFIAAAFAVIGGVSGLGSLLFAIGFAIHGLKSESMTARIEDLESVLAAQGEQLSRQQSGVCA